MSGTSADAVDAALVEIRSSSQISLIAFDVYPYAKSLQRLLLEVASGRPVSIALLCQLNFDLGAHFAAAVVQVAKRARLPLSKIALIGSHGQTLHHLPNAKTRSTLQIGEPSVIAERTGITTIADFRPRDMAAGGEGAPLTPYFHFHFLRHSSRSRAIINIGGVSNVTYLRAGAPLSETLAFDTGPGNTLIDGVTSVLTHGRKRMDTDGRQAARGRVHKPLLSRLMRHPYLRRTPPKSTGREVFGVTLREEILAYAQKHALCTDDIIATLTRFTTASIIQGLRKWIRGPLDEIFIGGGGVYNKTIMAQLTEGFSPIPVSPFDAIGYPARAVEAMTFAFLAYQTWHGKTVHMPQVTGAGHPVPLGKIIPGRGIKGGWYH